MSNVISFLSPIDRAFQEFREARERALMTGLREDADRAMKLFAVFLEAGLPKEQRWPREPGTLRLLAPSELRGRGA